MQKYIKTYLDYFGYSVGDFIPSELSGGQAVDIHHIQPRGRGGKDNIENLIALTREEHDKAHEYILKEEYLKEKHINFIKQNENSSNR